MFFFTVFTHVFSQSFHPCSFLPMLFSSMFLFTHVFFSKFPPMCFFSPIFFHQCFSPIILQSFTHVLFTHLFTKFSHIFFSPMFFHSCSLYKPIKLLQPHFQLSSKFLSTYLTFLLVLVPTTQVRLKMYIIYM